jgi:cytochrome c-type biogenesis protein CcmH/NrfG
MIGSFSCPHCGKEISCASKITLKRALLSLLLAAVAWGTVWLLNDQLIGKKPTAAAGSLPPAEESARDNTVDNDPALVKLREAAQNSADDLSAWKALGRALITKLQDAESPSQNMILEAVDAYSAALQISPKDPEALSSPIYRSSRSSLIKPPNFICATLLKSPAIWRHARATAAP